MVDPDTGRKRLDTLEGERDFDTTEIDRKITAPHSNRLILEQLRGRSRGAYRFWESLASCREPPSARRAWASSWILAMSS